MSVGAIFDIVVLVIAIFFGYGGLKNGLIREFCGLLGLFFGVWAGTKYSVQTGELLQSYGLHLQNSTLLTLCGLMIVLIIIWSVFLLIGKILQSLISLSGLSALDRLCGFIFGAGKFVLIACVVAASASTLPFVNKFLNEELSESVCWPMLNDAGRMVANTEQFGIQNALSAAKGVAAGALKE